MYVCIPVFAVFMWGACAVSSAHAFTLSGTLYTDAGSTTAWAGLTLNLKMEGSATTSTTTSSGGAWTFTNLSGATATTSMLVFVNGSTTSFVANTYITGLGGGSSASNIPLYKDTVIVMSTSSNDMVDMSRLSFFDSDDDVDVLYNATTSTTTVNADFIIATGTFSGLNALVLYGNYTNNSTFLANQGKVTFAAVEDVVARGNLVSTSTFADVTVGLGDHFENDGVTWTAGTAAGDDDSWVGITYGHASSGGLFVAVAQAGTDRVMTSPDGIAWTARSAAGDNDTWQSITYANGLFVAVGIAGDLVMTSPDGIAWTARSAAGNDDSWSDITYGNGLFVAVGRTIGDRVMTSPDGITWTARTAAGDNDNWWSVTYGNGLFVAAGNSGDRVMTSPDGITWTVRSAAGDNDTWYGIAYNDGLFVAAGNSGDRVMTSPDGITWTVRSAAGNNDSWNGLTYANGLFVAVGAGPDCVMTSPDGITWTARSAAGNNDSWYGIAYNDGLFVSVGIAGGVVDKVMTSDSGTYEDSALTFSNNASTSDFVVNSGSVVSAPAQMTVAGDFTQNGAFTAGSGKVILSGLNDTTPTVSGTLVGTSSAFNDLTVGDVTANDGITWTARSASEANSWSSVTYGQTLSGGLFVAVAQTGTNRVMTSPDGITWTARSAAQANAWTSITYGNGLFVAVAQTGTNRVMTSPDGSTWTARSASAANNWRSITYGNGLFVAVACDDGGVLCTGSGTNLVMTSPDGITWTARTPPLSNSWSSVTYGNGLFVAVSEYGFVMTSPDGITWTARSAAEANQWLSVTYAGGLFAAVAQTGTNRVMTSPDGITWTARTASEANQWRSVTYGNGLFVAVAQTGTNRVMTSPDGITWTARSASEANQWLSVTHTGGLFVALAQTGTNRVMTSSSTSLWPVAASFGSNASTSDVTVGATSTLTAPSVLTITGDYTNNGTFTAGSGVVYFGDATTSPRGDEGFDIATTSLASSYSMATTTTDTSMEGIVFNTDGTKMFMVGQGNDKVYSFTLTRAYDLTTASQTASTSVATQDTQPTDLAFNTDGTRLYIIGAQNDRVYRYDLGSAYNIASLTFHSSTSVATQETEPRGLALSHDGTKMFVLGETGQKILRYTLPMAFEIGTSTFHSSTSVSSQDPRPQSVRINGDGTRMFMLGASTTSEVNAYTLSTAYDLSTVSLEKVFSVVDPGDIGVTGLAFNRDGTRMFVTGTSSNSVFGYDLIDQMATGTMTGTSGFNTIIVAGDGIRQFVTNASTTNVTVSASSTLKAPAHLSIGGDYTNSGTFKASGGTTTFSGASAQALAGTLIATSSMGHVVFTGAGTKTFGNNATTTNITIETGATVAAPPALTIMGNYTNNGTFTAGSGMVYVSPTTTATTTYSGTLVGASSFNDATITGTTRADAASWTARSAAGDNDSWNDITYGNGLFVAVGENGDRVITSLDGITWTVRSAAGNDDLWIGITYGNGLFVAVGASGGTDRVITSPDGITWTVRSAAGNDDTWYDVTYGNGLFVAVGDSSGAGDSVITSPDGITWTTRTAAGDNDFWNGVIYSNGLFVAVGQSGDYVMTSPDGITWTARPAAGDNDGWQGITYGNGLFVAVGEFGDRVITSPDGITWTVRSAAGDNDSWRGITYNDGLFVATASFGDVVITSPDGITWTVRSAAGNDDQWQGITYSNGLFVAVGNLGDIVMTSSSTSLFPTMNTFASNASTSNFTIAASSTVNAPARLTIRGNYTNNGVFEAGTGTTTFAGTSAQIATGTLSSTSAFYNLEVRNTSGTTTFATTTVVENVFTAIASTTVAFPASATTTIASLNLRGTTANKVLLRSTQNGVQAKLHVTTSLDTYYLDVKDSDATPGIDLVAYKGTNSGNNTAWTFAGNPTLASASNQAFAINQATTSISTITLTDNAVPSLTAANDIRIGIATSTHNMRFDTTDTTATFGGTASGKVLGTVSYEGGGSVLVIDVTSNFSASDTLTISGLSFAQFAAFAAPASALQLYYDGAGDTEADVNDTATIAISGTLSVGEHDAGQATNAFTYQNLTAVPLYRFKMIPVGESSNIGTLTFNLTGVRKIDNTKLTNIALYRDFNANGVVDGTDIAAGGTGTIVTNGQTGTISFGTSFQATTSQNYIVVSDTVAIKPNEYMTMSFFVAGSVTGSTTLGTIVPTGSVSSIQHSRNPGEGGGGGGGTRSGAIGEDAPPGQATTTGGGQGGGEGIGETPGFAPPTANGTAFNEWTTGVNAYVSDGAYATAASTNLRQSYSVFGFNVPNGNQVDGIEVKLEASGSTAAGTIEVALSWNGDSSVTAVKTTSVLTGTDAVYTLGGPSDNWGRSWAASEFSNANFFVRVIAQPSGNTVRVDAMQVKPYHAATGGGGGAGGEI